MSTSAIRIVLPAAIALCATTPDTDDVTMVPVANSDTTMHDALWEWLNVGGGGTRNDVRYLDTNAPGGSNSGC